MAKPIGNVPVVIVALLALCAIVFVFSNMATKDDCTGIAYGTVSESTWNDLVSVGWVGDATDGREALYPSHCNVTDGSSR